MTLSPPRASVSVVANPMLLLMPLAKAMAIVASLYVVACFLKLYYLLTRREKRGCSSWHKADPTRLARYGPSHWGTPAACEQAVNAAGAPALDPRRNMATAEIVRPPMSAYSRRVNGVISA
jgi:hypothetical protein